MAANKKIIIYLSLTVLILALGSVVFILVQQKNNVNQKIFPAPSDTGPYSDK
ncbi:MAG: hypothetical protein Q7U04_14540 [Bacteriovorax sp.]|nr:hypothetical protein [Bacteriovorax sp.]